MSIGDVQQMQKLRQEQLHKRLRVIPMLKDPTQVIDWGKNKQLDENGQAEWTVTEICTVIGVIVVDPQSGKMLTHILLPEETICLGSSVFQVNMRLSQ